MVEQETIESIKQSVDLASVIESCGIELKKSGRSYKGFCPFHDDTKFPSLSVTPEKGLWQCFGCGAGGDVIDFLRKKEGLSFTEAVARLAGSRNPEARGQNKKPVKEKKKKKTKQAPELAPSHYKLLKRVVAFYHTAFTEDPRALEYLVDRGITNKQLFSDYRIGFANGTLLNVLPSDGETITRLKELGILNQKSKEHFYGCATFPLYDTNNNPVGMYGRRVHDMGDSAPHLYLPGERKGIFNRQGAVNTSEIHLTESILDSLSLINAGIHNTIPCYGTGGFTREIVEHLQINKISTVYISFDRDQAGEEGAAKVAATLARTNIKSHLVQLPRGYDLNSFLHPGTQKNPEDCGSYEDLVLVAAGLEPAPKRGNRTAEYQYKKTADGFSLRIGERFYEVRGINKKNNKLKATIKGIRNQQPAAGSRNNKKRNTRRFHVDTVDFYSARSRAFLMRGLAELFGAEEKIIRTDLEQLLDQAEKYHPDAGNEPRQQKTSSRDRDAALSFLKNPRLLEEVIQDLETIGYTGEEMNKLLCYIAAVSRKMDDPLSVMIQSRSAAGKSCLQDTILSLIPEEDYIKYTRLTDQALFYKDTKSLKHKILAIEELDGMTGAMYSIRTIQSSKKITVAYTGKDPVTGEMKTGENTVEGPVMVFITTTQVDIDGETASRFVFLSIDESREMTEKILCKQRMSHTMEGLMGRLKARVVIGKHLAAQRLLKPVKVINPYAGLLTYSSKSLRARRDHMKYLNLILAVTFLFQYQREHKCMEYAGEQAPYIEVTLADIEKAGAIAAEVLGRSLDELSPSSRKLLEHIHRFCLQGSGEEEQGEGQQAKKFTRRDIREFSGWSDYQVKTHIRQLEELEYIYSLTGRKGKEYVYELAYRGDPHGCAGKMDRAKAIGLADVARIREKARRLGIPEVVHGKQ